MHLLQTAMVLASQKAPTLWLLLRSCHSACPRMCTVMQAAQQTQEAAWPLRLFLFHHLGMCQYWLVLQPLVQHNCPSNHVTAVPNCQSKP